MKQKIYELISRSMVPNITRGFANKSGNYIALFHGVHKKNYGLNTGAQNDLTVKQFSEVIEWLKPRFDFISPSQLFSKKKKGILLTFDDGFYNNYSNVMPILAKLDIPGLFFISTQHIINPRNWLTFARERSKNQWKTFSEIPDNIAKDLYDGISKNQLKLALKKYPNIEIGCHTISHPELPNLSQKELENEVLTSKKYLEDIVNKEVIYFAYPRGIYKKRELKFVKKHFFAAFSVDNYAKNDPFQIPRISIHSSNTSYLNIKFSPLHKPPFTL